MKNKITLVMNEYVILYMDFLAAKDRMLLDTKQTLKFFYSLYHNSMGALSRLSSVNYTDTKARIFSDNIVIAFRKHLKHDDREVTILDIADAITFSVYFQIEAIKRGFLLRGGITIGHMYFDDVFVYGKGLLRSYYLENEKAVYPRVVIDQSVLEMLDNDENLQNFPKGLICIATDTDDWKYVDYLSAAGMTNKERSEIINSGRDIIEITLSKQPDKSVQTKMAWLKDYFHSTESKFKR